MEEKFTIIDQEKYQCVYNKVKREVFKFSSKKQKKALYRSYSHRVQFLMDNKNLENKEAWICTEYLSYGNVKINNVSYLNENNVFELKITLNKNSTNKLKTMSHFVCNVFDFLDDPQKKPDKVTVIIAFFDKNNIALQGTNKNSTTEPYEDFPLIRIENEDFDQIEEIIK